MPFYTHIHTYMKSTGASRWKPYFDVLPDAGEVYPSYIWKEEELDLLKGSPVYAASKSLRAKLEREYEVSIYYIYIFECFCLMSYQRLSL